MLDAERSNKLSLKRHVRGSSNEGTAILLLHDNESEKETGDNTVFNSVYYTITSRQLAIG